MSLTVKAFLEKDGKFDGEIRRVAIPADVSSSYAYMTKKIAGIFPSLMEGQFSLHWKDCEGDLVLFSTDEELVEALGFVNDSLFKIYIKAKESGSSFSAPPQETQGKVHPGIVCDGCNGRVKGTRYKCVECDDYDLCVACEHRGAHPEHNMMKITKPNRAPFYAHPHKGQGRFAGGPGGHGEFAPPPHFRRWMRRFMRRWHSRNTPGCPVENDSPDDELSPPEGFPECFGGARPSQRLGHRRKLGKCCRRSGSGQVNTLGALAREKAKESGQYVVDLTLDGMDKSVTMETRESGEDQIAMSQEKATEEITSATEKIVLDDCDGREPAVACEIENDRQPPEPAKMDVQNGIKDRRSHEVDDTTWTMLNVSPLNVSPSAISPTHDPTAELCPQSIVQASTVQAPPPVQAPIPAGSRSHTVQFQMPPQIVYPPASPRVAEALKQMMAMGFNNDGGWLTRLLESKNGDIIQVLDAIKPQPGRQRETSGGYMA